MPRVKIGTALPDREKLDAEIARLRDLDVGQLRSRWHTAFGRPAPAHLSRHLLFRSLAYRLQARAEVIRSRCPFRFFFEVGAGGLLPENCLPEGTHRLVVNACARALRSVSLAQRIITAL